MLSARHNWFYAGLGVSGLLYAFIGYFLERSDFAQIIIPTTILFIIYAAFHFSDRKLKSNEIIAFGVFLRLIFLFSFPKLSDDIYRFVWDGMLWHEGINPFEFLPSELIHSDFGKSTYAQEIYAGLNSKEYFSIYPPIHQLIFFLSTSLNVENLLVSTIIIRIPILLAELISMIFISKIWKSSALTLYAFNPLLIIELSGNLHFEAFLICFMLISIYHLKEKNYIYAGVFCALATLSKLWPLMFLPYILMHLGIRNFIRFGLPFSAIILLSFYAILPLDFFSNFLDSVDLYFRNFEFNASIFYILREIGFWIKGYDIIHSLGPALSISAFLIILGVSYWAIRKQIKAELLILIVFSIYLFTSTTVHPWYILLLIPFAISLRVLFPIMWSFLILLSYYAYGNQDWQESGILLVLEYVLLFVFLYLDIRRPEQYKLLLNKFFKESIEINH